MNILPIGKPIKPYLVGITGSLGTGKSTVGNILDNLGLYVIDTDHIVSEVLAQRSKVTLAIVREFGEEILNQDDAVNYLNKAKLAKLVFYDEKKRKKLESLIHPEVKRKLDNLIKSNRDKEIIFVLVPLLFESHMETKFDEIWCVICKRKVQLERLQKKGFKLRDINARINAQIPQKEKAKLSDFVIDNTGKRRKTKEQVLSRLKELAQLNRNLHLSFCK